MTNLTKEEEDFVRLAARQAQMWQSQITADEDLEKWVNDGNWTYFRAKVLDEIQREAFNTIKNPAFDPANLSQVAQLKALCQAIDVIETKITQRLATVQDARVQLQKLDIDATLKEDANGN